MAELLRCKKASTGFNSFCLNFLQGDGLCPFGERVCRCQDERSLEMMGVCPMTSMPHASKGKEIIVGCRGSGGCMRKSACIHVTSFVLENWIASFIIEGQYPSVSIDGTTEVLTYVHHKHRSVLLRKPVWILLRRDTLIGSIPSKDRR